MDASFVFGAVKAFYLRLPFMASTIALTQPKMANARMAPKTISGALSRATKKATSTMIPKMPAARPVKNSFSPSFSLSLILRFVEMRVMP